MTLHINSLILLKASEKLCGFVQPFILCCFCEHMIAAQNLRFSSKSFDQVLQSSGLPQFAHFALTMGDLQRLYPLGFICVTQAFRKLPNPFGAEDRPKDSFVSSPPALSWLRHCHDNRKRTI